jgi:hypothetical protein
MQNIILRFVQRLDAADSRKAERFVLEGIVVVKKGIASRWAVKHGDDDLKNFDDETKRSGAVPFRR